MKRIIVSVLVISLLLSTASLNTVGKEAAGERTPDKHDYTYVQETSDDIRYVGYVKYANMEPEDNYPINIEPTAIQGDSYTFYGNNSGDNIWYVAKTYSEQNFTLLETIIEFDCDYQDFGAMQFLIYNPKNDVYWFADFLPDFYVFPVVGRRLHIWFNRPGPAGTWYFTFLAGNKLNCNFNITIITSEPYEFSEEKGEGCKIVNGANLDISINIENTLIGWFGKHTQGVLFFSLAGSKYGYTTPSGEKSSRRTFEYFGLFRDFQIPELSWDDDSFFVSEPGVWEFKGEILFQIRCIVHIVFLYADVVLPR